MGSALGDGGGIVCGVVEPFEVMGRALGKLALGMLAGEAASNTVIAVPNQTVADWGELRRCRLDPALLPQDAVLIGYDPTF
mgnify:CR=1 FL=1|jgi:hypothetical protein